MSLTSLPPHNFVRRPYCLYSLWGRKHGIWVRSNGKILIKTFLKINLFFQNSKRDRQTGIYSPETYFLFSKERRLTIQSPLHKKHIVRLHYKDELVNIVWVVCGLKRKSLNDKSLVYIVTTLLQSSNVWR